VTNPSIRQLLLQEEELTEEKIDNIVSQFLTQVKDGTWQENGWPKVWTDYSVSKLAINAYSRILARRVEGHGLSVNCFCPGFTRTDMTSGWGQRSPDEAAAATAALVLLSPEELPTGKFFKWRTPMLYSSL
jgi:carbonyl reductase 1